MALKCVACKAKIESTFLGKIKGTFVKKKAVCSACQQKLGKEIVEKLIPTHFEKMSKNMATIPLSEKKALIKNLELHLNHKL